MLKGALIACVVAALCLTTARADNGSNSFTGNTLIRYCNLYVKRLNGDKGLTWRQIASGDLCNGYVSGVLDGILAAQMNDHSSSLCLPHTVTYSQAGRVVSKWLDSHPSELNDYAGILVFRAFQEAWPCKPTK